MGARLAKWSPIAWIAVPVLSAPQMMSPRAAAPASQRRIQPNPLRSRGRSPAHGTSRFPRNSLRHHGSLAGPSGRSAMLIPQRRQKCRSGRLPVPHQGQP